MGALTREELARRARRRRRRRRLERGVRRLGCAALGGGRACTSSSTAAWGGWARATARSPTASPSASRRAPGLELVGAMTHLATAEEPDRAFMRRAARALRELGRAAARARAGPARPRREQRRAARRRRGALRHGALRRRGLRPRPLRRRPGALGPRGGARAALLGRGAQAVRARRERRLRPHVRRERARPSSAVVPIGYGDGVRRVLSNNAEVLIGGRRRPLVGTVSMDNVTVELGAGSAVAVGAPVDPARRRRRRADRGRGDRRARQGTINYEVTCAISARVPRRYHRDGRMTASAGPLLDSRARCSAARAAGSSAARCATSCAGARPSADLDLVVDGAVERGRARAGARRARRRPSRSPTSSAPGASSRAAQRLAGRPQPAARADDRGRPARCATSRSTRSRGRSRAARRSTRSAARRTSRAGRLRLVAPDALEADPLRALRLVRLACELRLEPDDAGARGRARTPPRACAAVAGERIYAELRRVLASERADGGHAARARARLLRGRAARARGAARRRAEPLPPPRRARPHARGARPGRSSSSATRRRRSAPSTPARSRALLAAPLADELTRGEVLRFAALLHDIAKPQTRAVSADGRDRLPRPRRARRAMARAILARLRAAERVRAHVAALTRNHLRLGFLVHEAPLVAARALRLPRRLRPRRGRRHAALGRRPPGDARRRAPRRRSSATSSWRAR